MKTNTLLFKTWLLTFICCCSLLSQSEASISLKDSVDAAMEKQKHLFASADKVQIKAQALGNWIDGSPTLSAAYLKSRESFGTDEMELSLQLPIKSQSRRKIEDLLKQNQLQTQDINEQQQRLIITGLLREMLWDYQLEQAQIKKAEQKWELVSSLEDKFKILSESRALPEYIALLLQKESLDSQILLLQHKHNARTLFSQFKLLTGLSELPLVIAEQTMPSDPSILLTHPNLVALELSWQVSVNQLKNTNNNTQPWQLQVIAKRLDAPGASENQIGLGLAIPISLGSSYSPSQQSEYLKARNEFEFTQQKLFTSLKHNFSQALESLNFLQQKQTLLDKGKTSLGKLDKSINALLEANVPNKEVLIRNALDVIDAQSEVEINRIAIAKQIAVIRQVSGQTL